MKNLVLVLIMIVLMPLAGYAADRVDLNSATIEQIQELPGVGKKTAEAIVAARPFKSVDDLKNVKGIGDAKFAKIKDSVEVGAVPAAKSAAAAAADTVATKAADVGQQVRSAGASLKPGETININTASVEELDRLPGIGPAKAKAIIAARPFTTVDDLTKVKGIKGATLAKIKSYITVK